MESSVLPITEEFHHPVAVPVEDHGVPVPPHAGGRVAVHDAGDDGLLAQSPVHQALVHLDLRLVWSEEYYSSGSLQDQEQHKYELAEIVNIKYQKCIQQRQIM